MIANNGELDSDTITYPVKYKKVIAVGEGDVNMKRYILVISLIIILQNINFAYATSFEKRPIEEVIQDEFVDKSAEKDEVLNDIYKKENLSSRKRSIFRLERPYAEKINNLDDIYFGKPYKNYICTEQLLKSFYDGNPLKDSIIKLNYNWAVPIYVKNVPEPVDLFYYSYFDKYSKWVYSAFGTGLDQYQIELCCDLTKRADFLKKHGINKANFTTVIDFYLGRQVWIYVLVDEQEYFIPLVNEFLNNFNLENMKLYTRQEFEKYVNPVLKDNYEKQASGYIQKPSFASSGESKDSAEQQLPVEALQPQEAESNKPASASNDVQQPPQTKAATQAAKTEEVQQPAQSGSVDADKAVVSAAGLQKQTDAVADAGTVKSVTVLGSKQDSGNTAVKVMMWVLPIALLLAAGSFMLWKYKFSAKGKAE